MNKEEKEAIEEVKRIIEEIEEIYHYDCDREDEKYLKIVLNYINEYEKRITFLREEIYGLNKKTKRLQKENENLRKTNEILYETGKQNAIQEILNENWVSKNKIRTKIKELEEKCETMKKTYTETYALNGNYLEAFYQIVILRELLGDDE